MRSIVLCTSSTCTNEPTGEDLCPGYLNGREEKGMFEGLGTWFRVIWVVLEATRQIRRCRLSLLFRSGLYPDSCSKLLLVTCWVLCGSVTLRSCLSPSEIQWDCVRAATARVCKSCIRSSKRVYQPAVVGD